jgi:copper chaperone CopZ
MRTVTWHIPNYHCRHCFGKIKQTLHEIDGIDQVQGDLKTQRLTLRGNGPEVLAFAKRRLAEAGYPVRLASISLDGSVSEKT